MCYSFPHLVREANPWPFIALHTQPPRDHAFGDALRLRDGLCAGQNGAGKTTTIMMLCGFTELSDGEAVVAGFDVRTDMQRIYECMGVCPQHNLLWETLTALEHVRFYATLKGVPKASVQSAAMEALQAVSLASVAGKRAGEFSGGMKRRLSVAISLIGDPTVVFMDEPSTGLDPASRKQLWRTVHAAKSRGGCGIILTTHSMQEAEELCGPPPPLQAQRALAQAPQSWELALSPLSHLSHKRPEFTDRACRSLVHYSWR